MNINDNKWLDDPNFLTKKLDIPSKYALIDLFIKDIINKSNNLMVVQVLKPQNKVMVHIMCSNIN